MLLDDKNVSLLFFLGFAAAKTSNEELPALARKIKEIMDSQMAPPDAISQIQQLVNMKEVSTEEKTGDLSNLKLKELESKL